MPETPNAWLITATRGVGHQTIMVRGDIQAWLTDRKAKPTKDANRFTICGWRCVIQPLSGEVMAAMHSIFGDDKWAPASKGQNETALRE